ncbi:CAP Gly-rich domain-containing protein [Endogone sp. FLAS-F59071]|nr:CAP Gly-rich domain-containing protein [Endogone sp. FLAS-F59071]|eukprot:RUS12603.1 CAP Gly-rich domain-containing protein [Endogone sp. FLAS-F59071]
MFLLNGFASRPVRSRDKGSAESLGHSRSSGDPALTSTSAARSAAHTTAGNSSTSSPRRTLATTTSSPRSQQRQTPSTTALTSSSSRASQPRRVGANTSTSRSSQAVASSSSSSSYPPTTTRQATGSVQSRQPRLEPSIVPFGLGDRVQLPRRGADVFGTVRFIGQVTFAEGTWVGVEVNAGEGKNDGSVQGVRYFDVPDKHGLFVRSADAVRVKEDDTNGDGTGEE